MPNPREPSATVEAANRYAVAHGLLPDQRMALVRKTEAITAWLQLLRRTVTLAGRVPSDHPQRVRLVRELVDETVAFHDAHGLLTLVFEHGHTCTGEGIPLPLATDPDLAPYTFYPLFRDGVTRITLAPGVDADVLDLLADVLATHGRAGRDDAYTRLWLGRGEHMAVEVEPTLTADIAASLSAHGNDDLAIEAFLAALTSAAPSHRPSDTRPPFTANRLDALASQGVDIDTALRMLLDDEGAELVPRLSAAGAATFRTLLTHGGDIEARLSAALGTHGGGDR